MKTLIIVCALVVGCREKNLLYCDSAVVCTLPDKPYCNYLMHECHADPQPDPPDLEPAVDMAITQPDMTVFPDFSMPDFAPPPPHFNPDIQADLDRLGCAAAGCHAITPPLLVASPVSPALYMQNWTNFKADVTVDMGAASALILTKPLAGSGVKHNGSTVTFKAFADTSDATYQRWLRWINEGTVY